MSLPLIPSRKQSKSQHRSSLSTTLEKNLSSYALAASAAGVALLAGTEPASARVVITKVDLPVVENAGAVEFDINGDGQMDFALSALGPTGCNTSTLAREHPIVRPPLGCGFSVDQLRVVQEQAGNEIWQAGASERYNCAANLGRGARIDRLRPFAAGPLVLYGDQGSSAFTSFCRWGRETPSKPYLGVKFLDKQGQVHYGWVRVTNQGITATINGYAYETIPNKPILAGATTEADEAALTPADITPQPATLGRLALGASGLAAWRREEEVAAK